MQSTRYSCQILKKVSFSRWSFNKYSDIKILENSLVEADLFHADGRIDGRTNMMEIIVTFGNVAKAPKNDGQHTQDFALRQGFACGSRRNVFKSRSRNCEERLLASSCPSVRPSIRPHGTVRLPQDRFS